MLQFRTARLVCLAVLCLSVGCEQKPLPGIEYTFSSEVLSLADNRSYSGNVAVAGDYALLELNEGDGLIWREHVILITTDGGETFTVVFPEQESYYETSAEETSKARTKAVKAAFARLNIRISNMRSFIDDEGRDARILDYPTRRFRHDMRYDMSASIQGRGIDATSHIVTRIWTTDMLPERYASFARQQRIRTGMGNLDEVIARDMKEVKGFPLKEVVRTVMTVEGSEQTSTATMTVDEFYETDIPVSRFEVPDGYDEIDPPEPSLGGAFPAPS